MPYVVPNTFAAGVAISAPDLQENVDEMRDYVDGNVSSTDLAATNWAKSKHIMRGHYSAIVNMHSFATGLCGGRASTGEEMSFLPEGPTGRNSPTDPDNAPFPNTSISFYLPFNADVFFQFTAGPHTAYDPNHGTTKGTIFVDGVQALETQEMTFQGSFATTARSDFWIPHNRNVWSGFHIVKNMAAGHHTIGIKGNTTSLYTFLMNFSVSLEAFYR
jgi:hypothetical protein